MTDRELESQLALCEAASPGPWAVEECGPELLGVYTTSGRRECRYGVCVGGHVCVAEVPPSGADGLTSAQDRADADFIAAAREGWPAALRRLLHAEAILDAPRVALFADGREPTANERRLLNLLEWRMKETAEAKEEAARLLTLFAAFAAQGRRVEVPPEDLPP